MQEKGACPENFCCNEKIIASRKYSRIKTQQCKKQLIEAKIQKIRKNIRVFVCLLLFSCEGDQTLEWVPRVAAVSICADIQNPTGQTEF